jgi:thiamine kinase-like enzyme
MYVRMPTILTFFYFFICLCTRKKFIFVKVNPIVCSLLIFDNRDTEIIIFFKRLRLRCISVVKKNRIIVIKDTCSGLIYKYSYKDSIREIQNNYSTLKNVKNLSSPKCINFIKGRVGVLSSEETINAQEIFLSDLDPNIYSDSTFKNICTTLQKYHSKTLKQVELYKVDEMNQYDFLIDKGNRDAFNKVKNNLTSLYKLKDSLTVCKARIHGDITYRNILVNNQKLFFIDFERASFDFPEFDYLNFILDFHFHSTPKTSYRNYIDYLVDIYIDKNFLHIFSMLEEDNNFKSKNPDNIQLIYLKYLIRQVAIVTNVSYYEKYIDINSIYKSINNKITTKRGEAHDYR